MYGKPAAINICIHRDVPERLQPVTTIEKYPVGENGCIFIAKYN